MSGFLGPVVSLLCGVDTRGGASDDWQVEQSLLPPTHSQVDIWHFLMRKYYSLLPPTAIILSNKKFSHKNPLTNFIRARQEKRDHLIRQNIIWIIFDIIIIIIYYYCFLFITSWHVSKFEERRVSERFLFNEWQSLTLLREGGWYYHVHYLLWYSYYIFSDNIQNTFEGYLIWIYKELNEKLVTEGEEEDNWANKINT